VRSAVRGVSNHGARAAWSGRSSFETALRASSGMRRIFTPSIKQSRQASLYSNSISFAAAPCGGRVAFLLFASTPNEGWMERRQGALVFLLSRLRGRDVRAVRHGLSPV